MSSKVVRETLSELEAIESGKGCKIPVYVMVSPKTFEAMPAQLEKMGFPRKVSVQYVPVVPVSGIKSYVVVCCGDKEATLCNVSQGIFYVDRFLCSHDSKEATKLAKEFYVPTFSAISHQLEHFDPVLNVEKSGYDKEKLSYVFNMTHAWAYIDPQSCRVIGDLWKPEPCIKIEGNTFTRSDRHGYMGNTGIYQKTFTRHALLPQLFELTQVEQASFSMMP